MKAFIGVILIIVGIIVGLYFGIWWAFIGGIVQVIEQIRAETLAPLSVAIGIAKVMFAGLIGWFAGLIFVIPGWGLVQDS